MFKWKDWVRDKRNREWVIMLVVLLAVLVCYGLFFAGQQQSMKDSATLVAQRDEREIKLEEILSTIEGVGQVQVMIYGGAVQQSQEASVFAAKEISQIQGVIVTAEGADDLYVRLLLQQAVKTALDIPADCIEIYPMAKQGEE